MVYQLTESAKFVFKMVILYNIFRSRDNFVKKYSAL